MRPVVVRTSWYAITTAALVSIPSLTLSVSFASMIGVITLKRKEALGWPESKGLDFDKVEEMFGKVAEADDQEGAILLRLPQTLKLAIEKSAAVAGVSTNTWLMRCAERAIASEREQKANPGSGRSVR